MAKVIGRKVLPTDLNEEYVLHTLGVEHVAVPSQTESLLRGAPFGAGSEALPAPGLLVPGRLAQQQEGFIKALWSRSSPASKRKH